MSLFLKQSTAVVVSWGPALDKADGFTLKTGLVSALDHATTGIKLSKNGGALTIRHATVTATTYDTYGMYRVTLDTTDTNTLGTLRMAYEDATTVLPIWQDFLVLPANVYDSLVGGTDALDVSAIQLAGQTITAAAGVTFPTSVASPTNITAAAGITVSANNDKTGYSLTATTGLGNQTANITGNLSGSVGSVTGAVGSVTGLTASNLDATISSRLASASYTAPPSAAANASQVRTELTTELSRIDVATSTRLATAGYTAPLDAAGVRTAVGLATANLDTQLAAELAQATLARKILKNRTETNPATGVMTIYDDDGTTPLYTANLYTDVAGATLYAGTAAVNRRNALS